MYQNHWNTVLCDGSVNDKLFFELVDHSYDLIYKSLPKKLQAEITP
jgi:predicted DNA-binding protein (MmcQ/YjbR family)